MFLKISIGKATFEKNKGLDPRSKSAIKAKIG
jgi:hypothetical protein